MPPLPSAALGGKEMAAALPSRAPTAENANKPPKRPGNPPGSRELPRHGARLSVLSAPFRREVPEAARRARRERGSRHRGNGRAGEAAPTSLSQRRRARVPGGDSRPREAGRGQGEGERAGRGASRPSPGARPTAAAAILPSRPLSSSSPLAIPPLGTAVGRRGEREKGGGGTRPPSPPPAWSETAERRPSALSPPSLPSPPPPPSPSAKWRRVESLGASE